uniref:Uncharacterized protein n=1 Tax=Onchocerca volvulus TaxID=6282 RepID=A0A8R1TYK9_ONCVO
MNLHHFELLTPVIENETESESVSIRITSSPTPLSSDPQENHLLHSFSNYVTRKDGRQKFFQEQQHQQPQHRTGHHHPSFIRRLSAAFPSFSTDSMSFAAFDLLIIT